MDLGARLRGKRLFVTGASGGLGAHFATLAARHGAAVVVGARRRARLDALVADLGGLGAAAAVAVDLDVADEVSVAAALSAAEDAVGPLDVVVNNAGIGGEGRAAVETAASDFDAVMATNLRGVWLVATEAARRWRAAGRGGTIVNIASILGLRVAGHVAPYCVSKAGVVQMTKTLALEWARHGIRVNALAPGYIETDINAGFLASEAGQALLKRIPMRRAGTPDDLDGPFLLLATDASAWMTGSVVTVDGGHLVSSL
ncbi:SDR family oxidoreductase [Chelatococcus sp. SYSU_G07232]|uniref:SDR family oxidoreductase n=1 Tax=Chelatococcus albus TaxID=3047466 RepID=A0ABT7ALH6_9HYPH|nr:SDR family oxidoreductase [Chelatococcus sp. SYSU_G07232]MDJ1159446.1 SDR family oxidoreductase [Chelatococcus sp. SYSU_G07232]